MTFDVRSYCERIKQADPRRFEFAFSVLTDYVRGASMIADSRADETKMWAWVGPLAVELGVHRVTLECPLTGEKYADLLEATFAAVCDRLEADA